MLLRRWLAHSPRQAAAFGIVLIAHFMFLWHLSVSSSKPLLSLPPVKSIRVQTVMLQPVKAVVEEKSLVKKKSEPIKEAASAVPAKKDPPAPPKKTPEKKPAPQKETAAHAKETVKKDVKETAEKKDPPKKSEPKVEQKPLPKKEAEEVKTVKAEKSKVKEDKPVKAEPAKLVKTDKPEAAKKPKETAKHQSVSKPQVKTPPPSPPKEEDEEEDEELVKLLIKAKESMAKIDTKKATATPADMEVPKAVGKLSIDTPLPGNITEARSGYQDELVKRLQLLLKLPDYGNVKVELTLDKSGRIIKMDIIDAGNPRNSAYISEKIPSLVFPAFGNHFSGEESHTFRLTFSNDS